MNFQYRSGVYIPFSGTSTTVQPRDESGSVLGSNVVRYSEASHFAETCHSCLGNDPRLMVIALGYTAPERCEMKERGQRSAVSDSARFATQPGIVSDATCVKQGRRSKLAEMLSYQTEFVGKAYLPS